MLAFRIIFLLLAFSIGEGAVDHDHVHTIQGRQLQHKFMSKFLPQGVAQYPVATLDQLDKHRALQLADEETPPEAVDVLLQEGAEAFQSMIQKFLDVANLACEAIDGFNDVFDVILDFIQNAIDGTIAVVEQVRGLFNSFCDNPDDFSEPFDSAAFEYVFTNTKAMFETLVENTTIRENTNSTENAGRRFLNHGRRLGIVDKIEEAIREVIEGGIGFVTESLDDLKQVLSPTSLFEFIKGKLLEILQPILTGPCEPFLEPANNLLDNSVNALEKTYATIEEIQLRKSEFVDTLCSTTNSKSVISRIGSLNDAANELQEIIEERKVYLGKSFCDQATLTFQFIKLFRPFLGTLDGFFEYLGLYAAPECAGTTAADAVTVKSTTIPVVEACAGVSTFFKTAFGTARAVYTAFIGPTLDLFMTTEDIILAPLCSCRVIPDSFALVPGSFKKKAGCDGQDTNCDRIIDDCYEDHIKPSIELNHQLIPSAPFASQQDAEAFLLKHMVVSDDCSKNLSTSISLNRTKGVESYFLVETFDRRCVGLTENATQEKLIALPVDAEAPRVSCGFFVPQNPEGNFFRKTKDLRFPREGELLVIDPKRFFSSHVDVQFWHTIEDNDSHSTVDIEIEVFTNELVRSSSSAAELYLWQTSKATNEYKAAPKAGVILDVQSCRDLSMRAISKICNEEKNVLTRFYDIIISASDMAGHRASATCSIAVASKQEDDGSDSEEDFGTVLGEWSDYLRMYEMSSKGFLAAHISFEYDLKNPDAVEPLVAPEPAFPKHVVSEGPTD